MGVVDKVIDEIMEKDRTDRQQQHTQMVSLSELRHAKLASLSAHLLMSKTKLGSKLLEGAIDDAYAKVLGEAEPNINHTKKSNTK